MKRASGDRAGAAAVCHWRGAFESSEVDHLHAEAFGADQPGGTSSGRDWCEQVTRHSLGWVVARAGTQLVGFVNVPWDGGAHAWVEDTMVSRDRRRHGLGAAMIEMVRTESRAAGCEWLHVDFTPELAPFYVVSCGFVPSQAGLMRLDDR